MINLCKRLRGYHEEGFDWKSDGRFSNKFEERFVNKTQRLNMGIRDIIKSFVHLLEISEQYPNVDVEGALKILDP